MKRKFSPDRPLKVAVAGLGFVGRESARLLWSRRADYASRGAYIRLVAVCDRKASSKAQTLGLPKSVRRLSDYRELTRDPDIDVVVELFGGLPHAKRLVLDSLAAGKDVVSANKLLISTRYDEIRRAAGKAQRRVFFEAAVAGGIPILQSLREGLAANEITSAYGIFNGTTNYILSQMAHNGCEMLEALKEAQRLGMAEKDPTMDLNGSDTMHKVSIIASILTGRWVPPSKVSRIGIEHIEGEDIRYAINRLGHTVRLIGTVAVRGTAKAPFVEAHVQPTLIPFDHPLAAVHGGYNAALVQTSEAEDLMFYGKGAGPGPAASAVVGDVLALSRPSEEPAGFAKRSGEKTRYALECDAPYYLKLLVNDVPGALSKITGALGRHGISISEINQPGQKSSGQAVPVMITTHATSRHKIDAARKEITRLSAVSSRHSCLRFLP